MVPPAAPPAADRLRPWERVGLILVALLVLAFGAVVEVRSAFQKQRRTDFGVYARAAWAVRAGHDLYDIADDRGWHYCYPPPFAVLMTPLADPPAGEPRVGYLPFWAAVAVWYALSVGCAWFAADRFAAAVLPNEPQGGRRWWYARTVPLYVCVGGVGFTLARGQVNLLVVALVAGMFAAAVRNRRFAAGLWLGAAVCLKVIPAFLGLWVLLRRDARAVGGAVAALAVGLLLIPAAVWGVGGAINLNTRMLAAVLQPGATGTGDQTRAKELTDATATDSQSFQAALHMLQHPDPATRPNTASPETRLAHWVIGGVLTLAVVGVWWRKPNPPAPFPKREGGAKQSPSPLRGGVGEGLSSAADSLILLGVLCLLMLHLTPVSHMHYYALGLPLACGLWLKGMADRPAAVSPDRRTVLALAAWGVTTAAPLFPGPVFDRLRECGLGVLASAGLGAFALAQIGRRPAAVEAVPAPRRLAA